MKKVETVVVNKWTYLWLLVIPGGIGKIVYDANETFGKSGNHDIMQLGNQVFISLIVMVIGVSLFFKFNTFSHWMNPNHPKTKNDQDASSMNKSESKS